MTFDRVTGIPRHPHDGADIAGDMPSVKSVHGVTLRSHAARHALGGADPLDPAATIRAARITSAQTISHATFTAVIWNSLVEEDDVRDALDLNTSTGVFTINTAGVYLISFGVVFSSSDYLRIILLLDLNSGTTLYQDEKAVRNGGIGHAMSGHHKFAAADTISCNVFHTNTGVTSETVNVADQTRVEVTRLSPA